MRVIFYQHCAQFGFHYTNSLVKEGDEIVSDLQDNGSIRWCKECYNIDQFCGRFPHKQTKKPLSIEIYKYVLTKLSHFWQEEMVLKKFWRLFSDFYRKMCKGI